MTLQSNLLRETILLEFDFDQYFQKNHLHNNLK